ncbi:uncharacterized protein FPRO_16027 [Fusarium proliferatum ET1]|uniref:Uncharacterized protein n=1 Tax=Fusarium proliferatum (strain ET1) TaxID=1227346 RepID=A0A1L7WB31_FUSPR|nr:uncharacterized protein FPRO_16027 [Fusarium proliferatum ET1]CZR49819.1 uncharacterized protein FPRO_16027 [Fusarium proliferatum ET1]
MIDQVLLKSTIVRPCTSRGCRIRSTLAWRTFTTAQACPAGASLLPNALLVVRKAVPCIDSPTGKSAGRVDDYSLRRERSIAIKKLTSSEWHISRCWCSISGKDVLARCSASSRCCSSGRDHCLSGAFGVPP